ncbi:UDP-N-acetyl glucosamine 2-epimerase [Oleiphilus sp. HI0125]|uniref:non-hydrolyzing UDP-N-acetylglucosamine 2-epimerase n=2 Tax=Oleiphilus sp. HI0125 TaxID=1822266 RepID=UPI0007C31F7F|nr:UDP-N-acetylglucosamine 2-epimerase (non-hydrolyzing) [Oleiphilus sp. HI0125]KZZ60965.1 UDP-N-acetyl glucosamine 2-epimerase [Oleiphilus sp. HI0125]
MPSKKKRVLTVFGTRPEAIKMAPVVKALEKEPKLESLVCVTAQHREMLDQVLKLFEIKPDFDLNIMKARQDLFDITSKVLLGLREVLRESQPDLVLVHGDTTTCFAAALAAFYEGILVGHVEAGLRTGDLRAPFPEEANRSLVGRISQYHFAPTSTAKQNLLTEGINESAIHVTGNTVIDALLSVREKVNQIAPSTWSPKLPQSCIEKIKDQPERFILITGHRRENFGQGFIDFCEALKTIVQEHPNWLLVYPVHLNPNVQKPVNKALGKCPNILLIEPQDYLPFVWLLDKCDMVITDSGGIQEEAPSFGKPVLVTREVTERPEAVEAGTVRLVGTSPQKIIANTFDILLNDSTYKTMSEAHNPYGDGEAAQRIVKTLKKALA